MAAERDDLLRAYDVALMATAAKWNLDVRAHRQLSAAALRALFFEIVGYLGVDLFVEAGAKEASASRQARQLLPDAAVTAFEANPFTYRRFTAINDAAAVEYRHLALTDRPGPVTFHVLRNAAGNPIGNGQASLFRRERGGDAERGFAEVTVDGMRLDDAVAGHRFTRAAMWVDVEGGCSMVLPGARDTLARTDVVMIEVEDRNDWGPQHWLREQVTAYLFDLGLVPVARDFEYPTQFNLVFVRAELCADAGVRKRLTRFASAAVGPPAPPPFPRRARAALVRRGARATAALRPAALRHR